MRPSRFPYVLAEIAAPPACGICAGTTPTAESFLCSECDRELERGSPPPLNILGITQAWAARPYTGKARALITTLKFHQLLPAGTCAAQLIAAEAPPSLLASRTLVPVPPDPLRTLLRGFDPAHEITVSLSRLANLPISACLRRRHGARQVGRSRRSRLSAPPRVRATAPPTHALLLDDVTTTGATLTACATALRAAGCTDVNAVVFAAAPA